VEKTVINRLLDFCGVLDNFEINCIFIFGGGNKNFKFEVKFNKFVFFHSKNYLHEMTEQEKDMKHKRIHTVNDQRGARYC
jgi:hypothetical protein